MEFKFRAVDVDDNKPPPTTSHSPSPLTYLPDLSLQIDATFSASRMPLSGQAEVRRELAIQGLVPHWSTSTVINPVSVAHIRASQPLSILPPAEINPSQEISDKGKVVIVLDKPDPALFYAKRKATTPPDSQIEPFAFSLKKKRKEPKEKWSCALCGIKATNESGLNAHLNGKKHKAREARQNRKVTQSVVATTELAVDAEKNQQLLQPCTALEVMK